MVQILRYLADKCAFLFRPRWFRFVDSLVETSFGGDAMVILESSLLRLRLTYDRGQLLMEFQPIKGKRGEWFSPGLLRGVLLGDRGESEVLDDDWAGFLSHAISELEQRLSDPKAANEVIDQLRAQAKQRAKTLFG
jgi:hypothetical protein